MNHTCKKCGQLNCEEQFAIRQAAAALGRLGGLKTSEQKKAACKENGKKSGWKKGRSRKKEKEVTE